VSFSCNNIGSVLFQQGKHQEALEYYFRSLSIKEKVYGKDHFQVASSCTEIAFILFTQGKHNESVEYSLKVLVIYKKVHGKEIDCARGSVKRLLLPWGDNVVSK